MQVTTNKLAKAVVAAAALLLIAPSFVGNDAHANSRIRKKIEQKAREAMENYDLLEYEEAKRLLNEAIVLAKKNKMADDESMAQVHLDLGIVYFAGLQDVEAAKLQFIDAVQINPEIEIDAAYKTKEMDALLGAAREEFGAAAAAPAVPEVDCKSLEGIAHTLVDDAPAGADKEIDAHVSGKLKAAKVSLFYRPQGNPDFLEAKMEQKGDCTYAGVIPGDSLQGDFLHYYVAAYNDKGKIVASKGSAASPNIISITEAAVVDDGHGELPPDRENPLGDGGSGGTTKRTKQVTSSSSTGGGISKEVSRPSRKKFFLSVSAGTGGGYVSGNTEQEGNEVGCCVAPAYLHLFPEVGYYLSKQTSISVGFRMGFPLSANIPGHATAAPSGMLRLRHALDKSGDGLLVSGGIGGGIVRHTVALENSDQVDTSASGPLLLGGGAGYSKAMGGTMKLVAEVNAFAAIPVVDTLGNVEPNFAFHVDFNLGLLLAF